MFQPTLDRKKLKEEYKIESENASIPPLSNIKKPVRSEIPMPLNITGVK